jgi:hypothetical protein
MGIIFATNFTTEHKQADSVPIFPKPLATTTK